MNTIVFVLVVISSQGYAIPTIEFKTLAKCESAIQDFEKANSGGWATARSINSKCLRIEK
jgi:hypothetical protein